MTSVVRFEEWQEPTGTTAATTDSSGNVTFDNDVTVTGTITSTGNPQGLTFIKSVTIGSGVSSVTVSGVFSADFQNYKILIDVADSTGDTAFHFQIGAATAGYYGGHYAYRFNGATYNNFSNNGAYT